MAESSYANVVVIGSQYYEPYPVDLVISTGLKKMKDGLFVVSDLDGNILFKARDKSGLHSTRTLLDAAANPLVTFRRMILSAYSRCNAFRGESTEEQDFIFTVKSTKIFQRKMLMLAVFLANNTSKEKDCDFMIKGSWSDRSCAIYAGDSSTIIAQMHQNVPKGSLLIGKDNFMVTVFPNVDQAFIVSLIATLDANFQAGTSASAAAAVGDAREVVNAVLGAGFTFINGS